MNAIINPNKHNIFFLSFYFIPFFPKINDTMNKINKNNNVYDAYGPKVVINSFIMVLL